MRDEVDNENMEEEIGVSKEIVYEVRFEIEIGIEELGGVVGEEILKVEKYYEMR